MLEVSDGADEVDLDLDFFTHLFLTLLTAAAVAAAE